MPVEVSAGSIVTMTPTGTKLKAKADFQLNFVTETCCIYKRAYPAHTQNQSTADNNNKTKKHMKKEFPLSHYCKTLLQGTLSYERHLNENGLAGLPC